MYMEILNAAYETYLYATAEDFETCADPRAYIRASNRLHGEAVNAGMAWDNEDVAGWTGRKIARWLSK